MEAKLYVGNLSYTTSEDELRTLFAQAGHGRISGGDQRSRYRHLEGLWVCRDDKPGGRPESDQPVQ